MSTRRDLIRISKKLYALSAEAEIERLLKAVLPPSPFSGKVFAVGGYVRDQVMGSEAKDLDVVIEGKDGAKSFVNWLKKTFPEQTTSPRQLGAGYPIWQIVFKDNVTFKGEEFKTAGGEVEAADSQKESFPDESSRQRVTEPGTIKDDIERRDFTVNMLLKDLSSGDLVDLTGTSVSDIKNGILRGHPGVNFQKILRDDPLRSLRLVRFQAKYGWKVPLSVIRDVRANAERISIVSAERIREELVKIMKAGKLAQAVRFMSVTGLLKHILPEIEALRGVSQKNAHGWHAEGDVLKHTLMVLRNAKPGVESQMAALLHDVGKPSTQESFVEFFRFKGHDKAGAEIAEAMMRRMKFDNATTLKVKKMVESHMRPLSLIDGEASAKSIRKFVRAVGEELVGAVLDLAEADALGTLPSRNDIPDLRGKIEDAMKSTPVSEKPILDGKEVMDVLGIKPGKDVGRAKDLVREIMDEAADKGGVLTKEEAKQVLKRKWSS